MRYRLIHPNAETTNHPRILFLQEYDGYLSAIYEHVSIQRGVTRLWLVSSSYKELVDELDPETTIFDISACEHGRAMNVTDDEIARYSGNLITRGLPNARASV